MDKRKLAEAARQYGNGYDLNRIAELDGGENIGVVCPDHGVFFTTWTNFLYQKGCPDCRGHYKRAYPARRGLAVSDHIKPRGRPRTPRRIVLHTTDGGELWLAVIKTDPEAHREITERRTGHRHRIAGSWVVEDLRTANAIETAIRRTVAPCGGPLPLESVGEVIQILESFSAALSSAWQRLAP